MLGTFFKKLLFTRQFFYGDGTFELLGGAYSPLPLEFLLALEASDPEMLYGRLKEHVERSVQRSVHQLRMRFPELSEILPQLFEVYGLGKLELVDLDVEARHAIVRIHDSPLPPLKSNATCSIMCGVLSGFFSGLFQDSVDASVNKCVLKGDEYCEFLLK
ncbi:MAG: hypothetical protein ACQESG_02195 [Nanobdellota archaeon]